MSEVPKVEFEVGASVANEYLTGLLVAERKYLLQPMDDQPTSTKHFILHQEGKSLTRIEIILHENGTWTAIVKLPVCEDPAQ